MPATQLLGPTVTLKQVRRAHTTLTLKQLAERITDLGVDITEAGLSNVENGNKVASDRLLIAWSQALGFDHLDVSHGSLRPPVEAGLPANEQTAPRKRGTRDSSLAKAVGE